MKTIKAKLSAILLLSLGIVLAMVIWGISSLWGQVHQYQGLIMHEAKDQQRVLEIASDFKVQVQEWKNVLLRGSDDKKREKYWSRFQERESKIQQNINKLHTALIEEGKRDARHQESPAAELVGSFAKAHLAMGKAYRTGFDAFVAANFKAEVGDKAVSGIDREPAKLLAAAAEELNTLMQTAAKSALEHSQSVIITTIILVVIGIVLAITLFLVMASRMIIRPVHTLTESISHLAASDYSKEITYTNTDEIGNLADNARLMQQNMKDVLSTLMQSADKAANAASHLSSSSTEARKTATDQQFQTEQVATAMNEMSTTVHEVAQSAQTAANSAQEADRLTKEGHKVVTGTIDAINNLALEVERTSTVVESLADDSQSIGGILDVIRSIAEQTNLLALNAAIEAARAGDQGRGFAVVADEVRSLAQRTQESTAEIQKMIEKLQAGANDAVSVLISGREQAKLCVDKAALTDAALDEIEQAIAAINDMNVHIASASEEQSTVAEEINQNVIAINQSTEVTVGNVSDIENASGEVASLSQQFNGITQRFTV